LPALNRSFLPAEFATAAAAANVEKFIFVECGCEPAQNLAEVDWISALAKSEPRLKGIIAVPFSKDQGWVQFFRTNSERIYRV
jgi:predicted TIM-barrel fold metal-dependent hydrolase